MRLTPLRAALAAALAAASFQAPAALDIAGIDKSIDACTDFYRHTNRAWLETTEIPADRTRWGSFEIIAQRNEKLLTAALDEALAKPLPPEGTVERKVFQFYRSGMDTAAIERHGLKPMEPIFAAAAVKGTAELPATLARYHAWGVAAGFDFDADPDAKDSTRYIAELNQSGLGMDDRDYYFLDDERSKKLREGYLKHVENMFRLAGAAPEAAQAAARTVIAMETELARGSMTALERRDVDKTYNKMTLARLAELAPGFDWRAYFTALGTKDPGDINVSQPEFMKAFAKLAAERSPAEWQIYLRWHALKSYARVLPAAFEDEYFDFHSRQFQGVKVQPPRHRRVFLVMGDNFGANRIGHGLGKVYVDRAFSPESKARALELINNVKSALEDRLKTVDWMTEETRKRSLEKAAAMKIKIGYPDRWRDFSTMAVGDKSYAENFRAANEYDMRRFVARVGKPVDRGDWWMSPHIVNAYYSSSNNEIVFPAAILQPPYFDAKADEAYNYGGIGMIIGHEITHGFDNRGRRYDKDGNLRDWWTAEDSRRYEERARKVAAQYSALPGIEGVKVSGDLTLGENISDIGGMKIAFDAMRKALAKKPQGPIQGYTQEQRFFIAFSQAWRSRARTEWEVNSLRTGQHSLPRFRVKGPLAHMPEFAKAFGCAPEKALLSEAERANIW
jgi:putative endopeptidase